MAKKNHLMTAAMSVLQHAAEMCEEGRPQKSIKKYLKQGVGMVKQAANRDADDADSDKPAKGAKGRKAVAEPIQAAPTANGASPIVPAAVAAAKVEAEKPKTGMFGKS